MLIVPTNGARETFEILGSRIHFAPCGWGKLQQLRRQHRDEKTLIIDLDAVRRTLLEQHVLSWENVQDENGEPVLFSHDALLHLAPDVLDDLINKILASVTGEEAEVGNSPSSLST